MKKNWLFALGLSLFVSCVGKDALPENPKDKEEYKDAQGNSWFYNAMLMRWALTPSGSSSPSYFYYPGNNSWKNTDNVAVAPPSGVKPSVYRSSSVKPNSGRVSKPVQSNKPAYKPFGRGFSKPIGG